MIINNVKLVLENEVVHGSLEMQDGEIRAFAESQSHLSEAMDGEGGWLLPGLIELHTDNLDKFFTPRPKVDWPAHSAMSSHDALMVAAPKPDLQLPQRAASPPCWTPWRLVMYATAAIGWRIWRR